jgi:PAS domain S-box-containing protein
VQGGFLKVLLLDDPIGSLSRLEERFGKNGIEAVRAWDVSEARQQVSSEHFDGIVASTICILGDAVTFCLESKHESKHPMMVSIHSPYPLDAGDEKYLRSIGIDHVSSSVKDENIIVAIKKWQENGGKDGPLVPERYDAHRVMEITKASHDAALKDLASRAIKLEEILENASDVIYELDPYGRIILISKVIEDLTGYTRDELLGMSALDVTSADSLEVVADHISMLLSGQMNPPAVEIGVQCKNGHVIPAEMIVRPIRHSNQVVGILGIGRNVEERKRLEESLRRVINEKDFYLDLMSHDLQNFNTAIVGYLEMILATEGLDPKIDRYAKGAFRQVMQTAHLIAHLKRVAQIRQFGAGNRVRKDLKEILQRSVTNIQSKPEKNNVAITLECPEEPCGIMAGDDMNDLLELVVTSAARYSLSDLLHLKISVMPEVTEGQKFWTISISGKSLRLSKPVVQCVMSQDYAGCQMIERPDLQLLVVRAIVETQGGRIEAMAQDNGNRGDRFVLRIPQA